MSFDIFQSERGGKIAKIQIGQALLSARKKFPKGVQKHKVWKGGGGQGYFDNVWIEADLYCGAASLI